MKKIYLEFFIVPIVIFLTACATPIVYEELNTINDRVAAAQVELKSLTQTANRLKSAGIIVSGTPQHAKVKTLLQDAETAIQTTIDALRLSNITEAENQEQLFIEALYALRGVLTNE